MNNNTILSNALPTLVSGVFFSNGIFDEKAYLEICCYGVHKLLRNGTIQELEVFFEKTDIEPSADSYDRNKIYGLLTTTKPENFAWFCSEVGIDMKTELGIQSPEIIAKTNIRETLISDLIDENGDNHEGAMTGIKNIVKLGLDCNNFYVNGITVLHYLVFGNWAHHEVIIEKLRLLLDLGANPNLKAIDGISLLKLINDPAVANFLLHQSEYKPKYKAVGKSVSIDKKDFYNRSVYQYCLENGGISIAISRIEKKILLNDHSHNILKASPSKKI